MQYIFQVSYIVQLIEIIATRVTRNEKNMSNEKNIFQYRKRQSAITTLSLNTC